MNQLQPLIASELSEAVDPRVTAMAIAIAAQHSNAARAILFYGSCLRQSQLDGLMLDFYLILSDYPSAYPKRWLATANRLIPPNVFPFAHEGLAAKYAVLSEDDFLRLTSANASSASVWARFCQPVRLVWSADEWASKRAEACVTRAVETFWALAAPLADSADSLTIWKAGFAQTYKSELRAERQDRSASIVDADPERYQRIANAIPATPSPFTRAEAEQRWRSLQRSGKLMSVIRLAKASLTFAGGIDYLAWKINRHAGTQIEITPWQRRHPLLAAITLVPKLLTQGAIK